MADPSCRGGYATSARDDGRERVELRVALPDRLRDEPRSVVDLATQYAVRHKPFMVRLPR